MKTPVLLAAAAALLVAGRTCAEMNTAQTVSDQAQQMTVAFDGLAFLTSAFGADTFLPPGKVADFSGFQYLRDNDPTELGHNTEFVTIIARNILGLLTAAQLTQLVQRAESQIDRINAYGYGRFPLIEAFRRNLAGDLPAGSAGLDWAAVTQHSADLYHLDGLISLDRAQLFGDILRSLTPSQKSAVDALVALNGIGYWPTNTTDPLRGLNLSPAISVGVMTYASEMYSWYAGNVEADTYFCPERQGTYFGSFYLKDGLAMNSVNYTIDSNLTADYGDAFLAVLTPAQQRLITNLVAIQKPYLYDLVDTRRSIATLLRGLITTNTIATNTVLSLCRRYGELDGMIVYAYATHFAQVGQGLTTNQQAALQALRVELLTTNYLYPAGAFLYSAPIPIPTVTNSALLLLPAATNRLPLVDSGQTNHYTPVFGEDADYTVQPPAYTQSGGIVQDTRTGRMWQQTDGGEMTWEAAQAYATNLALGGYRDWRLPTAQELFRITDQGRSAPALDTSVFTATTAEYWWSQDQQANATNNIWSANAGGGIGPHPRTETLSAGGSKRFHVRCVRGAPEPSASRLRHHFLTQPDGTVLDLDTGLTWQQAESVATNWTAALQTAEALSLGGYSDWRLPNVKELQTLVDETRAAPAADTNFFPAVHSAGYWSSTTLAGTTGSAWNVNFTLGIASYAAKTEPLRLRCVRGGTTGSVVVAAGATLVRLVGGLGFTESPAADATGQIYFSAIPSSMTYRWSLDGTLSVFRTNTGNANGLCFRSDGALVSCEGGNGRITLTTRATNSTTWCAAYNGTRFNEPNDLWLTPAGGIYFTDPVYTGTDLQGGEHVYYLAAGTTNAVRVTTDLIRPNGLVGTTDGQTLYVADWGASTVYRYAVQADGTLSGKTVFAAVRCDGMTIDTAGRLYGCGDSAVHVFSGSGAEIEQIPLSERPTNVEFGGALRQFLYVTTEGGALYAIRMAAQGISAAALTNLPPVLAILGTAPLAPRTTEDVWLTARVTDDRAVAAVEARYAMDTLLTQTNTLLLETMRSAACKPWTGDGCDNSWTVTVTGSNPFEQRTGDNYGAGNPCGLEFKLGTANLTDSMITLSQGISAQGSVAGYVEFSLCTTGLASTMGWTLQLDNGSGFTTRLSELSGSNHTWQTYHYELTSTDLVSALQVRFQFRGGSGDPRISLDRILVGASTGMVETITLLDDGLHEDGAAGDGIYGGMIPAQAAAGVLAYYLIARDSDGATTCAPATAPATAACYRIYAATTDTLGDGLPDWWRARHFGGTGASTNAASANTSDPDGDGFDNLAEYLADTSPTNAGSCLLLTSLTNLPGGLQLTWTGGREAAQVIEYCTNLTGLADWTPLQTNTPPTEIHQTLLHDTPASTLFYRIRASR